MKHLRAQRNHRGWYFGIILAVAATAVLVRAQTVPAPPNTAVPKTISDPATEAVFRQLLERPAPTPRLPESELGHTAAERPKEFFDPQKPPPDNAPIADLVDYWTNVPNQDGGIPPTESVKERLLSACESDPRILAGLLPYLPDSKGTPDRVAGVYQSTAGDNDLPTAWHVQVEAWLKFNSTLFLSDLTAEAERVKDLRGEIQNEHSLTGLAKVDPEIAKPILLALLDTGQLRSEMLATALLFRIAVDDHDEQSQVKYGSRLRVVAEDRSAPAKARDVAIEGLLRPEWSGRDEWYQSLFADASLLYLGEGTTHFNPLLEPLEQDPDKWIPVLTKLIAGDDHAVGRNAGNCLAQFVKTNPRRDAILPLLPLLEDWRWLGFNDDFRTWLIQKLGTVDVPECVPGLIWVVKFDIANRRSAATGLIHYHDARAVPALIWVLSIDRDDENRNAVIGALVAGGGISEFDQFKGVELYATKLISPDGRDEVMSKQKARSDPLPLSVAIGKYLAEQTEVSESLASMVLERADGLRRIDPDLAGSLFEVAHHWQVAAVDLDLLRRIREGTADSGLIVLALERRVRMRERAVIGLQSLVGSPGFASGVGAVLAADDNEADHILDSSALMPKTALLVCARLVQMPLPVRSVAELLNSKNQLLAKAAERYLLAEDSREARQLLWEHFPQQAYVTGWRENLSLFRDSDFATTDKIERNLQEEMFAPGDAPRELYAILDRNKYPSRILRIYRDRAVYTRNESEARYRETPVTINDVAAFRRYIAGRNLTLGGPQFGPCESCEAFEFVAMNRGGARRTVIQSDIFLRNRSIYGLFRSLGLNAKTHYRLEATIKGVEVLIDAPAEKVRDVWQNGTDLRVRIEHDQTPAQRDQDAQDKAAAELIGGRDESVAQRAYRHRQVQREHERLAWFGIRDAKLVGLTARPAQIMSADETDLDFDDAEFSAQVNRRIGQATAGSSTVLAADKYPGGLWIKPGVDPARLISGVGTYRDPVVSADGAWVVATRPAVVEYRPTNYLIRLNVSTGQEHPVDLPVADQVDALAYLPALGRFVVRLIPQAEKLGDEPAAPVFYLLEPATGRFQPVTGDFKPLLQVTRRMLQPTLKPDECWAAIPDREKNETQVGRYDLKDFSFHPVITIPHLAFDSMSMWVDEGGGKLLIVFDGQLIRLPLDQSPPTAAGK